METIIDMPQNQAPMEYGGFLNRFVALIIDSILVGIFSVIAQKVLGQAGGSFLSFVVAIGYYGYFESSEKQATLGKQVMGLIVTDLDGDRISFGKAALRYLCKILSGLILGIGYIMAAFTDRKQGLHDMIAGTLVLKAES